MASGPLHQLLTLMKGEEMVITTGVCFLTLAALDSDVKGLMAGITNYYPKLL